MEQVKVSVIIPVYNTEKYLSQCLDSVVNQTLKDIEIICVDDGSTDSSLEILQEYAEKDPRVKIIQQQNQYAGVARNKGMEIATGKYYVFLDSDDFFEPELLELQYKQCEKYGADIGLCSGDRYDQKSGEYLETSWYLSEKFTKRQPFNRKVYKHDIFKVSNLAPWTKIFSAEFVKRNQLRFQNLPRANDVFFVMTALVLANNIVSINKKLVHYRIGQTTNLQANNKESPLAFCEALSAVKERLQKENLFEEVKYGFANSALSQSLYTLESIRGSENYTLLIEKLMSHYMKEFGIIKANLLYLDRDRVRRWKEICNEYKERKLHL